MRNKINPLLLRNSAMLSFLTWLYQLSAYQLLMEMYSLSHVNTNHPIQHNAVYWRFFSRYYHDHSFGKEYIQQNFSYNKDNVEENNEKFYSFEMKLHSVFISLLSFFGNFRFSAKKIISQQRKSQGSDRGYLQEEFELCKDKIIIQPIERGIRKTGYQMNTEAFLEIKDKLQEIYFTYYRLMNRSPFNPSFTDEIYKAPNELLNTHYVRDILQKIDTHQVSDTLPPPSGTQQYSPLLLRAPAMLAFLRWLYQLSAYQILTDIYALTLAYPNKPLQPSIIYRHFFSQYCEIHSFLEEYRQQNFCYQATMLEDKSSKFYCFHKKLHQIFSHLLSFFENSELISKIIRSQEEKSIGAKQGYLKEEIDLFKDKIIIQKMLIPGGKKTGYRMNIDTFLEIKEKLHNIHVNHYMPTLFHANVISDQAYPPLGEISINNTASLNNITDNDFINSLLIRDENPKPTTKKQKQNSGTPFENDEDINLQNVYTFGF